MYIFYYIILCEIFNASISRSKSICGKKDYKLTRGIHSIIYEWVYNKFPVKAFWILILNHIKNNWKKKREDYYAFYDCFHLFYFCTILKNMYGYQNGEKKNNKIFLASKRKLITPCEDLTFLTIQKINEGKA